VSNCTDCTETTARDCTGLHRATARETPPGSHRGPLPCPDGWLWTARERDCTENGHNALTSGDDCTKTPLPTGGDCWAVSPPRVGGSGRSGPTLAARLLPQGRAVLEEVLTQRVEPPRSRPWSPARARSEEPRRASHPLGRTSAQRVHVTPVTVGAEDFLVSQSLYLACYYPAQKRYGRRASCR
jgi:hypothetical protein